jgi:phage terminase large subunit-like protein
VKPITAASARRSAPRSALEAGGVVLRGRFEALEVQLLGTMAGGGYGGPGQSPNCADAMVGR